MEQAFSRGNGITRVQTVDLSNRCLLFSPSHEKFCSAVPFQPVGFGAEVLEWFIMSQRLKTLFRPPSELMVVFPWIRKIGLVYVVYIL